MSFIALEVHAHTCLKLGRCSALSFHHKPSAQSASPSSLNFNSCCSLPSHSQIDKRPPSEGCYFQSSSSLSIRFPPGQPYQYQRHLNTPRCVDLLPPFLLLKVLAHYRLNANCCYQDTQKPPSMYVPPECRLNVQTRERLRRKFAELLPVLVWLHEKLSPYPLNSSCRRKLYWKLRDAISSYALLYINRCFLFRTVLITIEKHTT
mmetsp:Transcript_92441/g.146137  ORF Transcript_92441/g.146137 Transcript_92441/m.146137 type:complete len:205 (+) Transcript_92441:1873-2487(+)